MPTATKQKSYTSTKKVTKRLILNFLKKVRNPNETREFHGRGHFNKTMPGVYHNTKWKYFYRHGGYYNKKINNYPNLVIFYNTPNANRGYFIHPITGARKPVKDEYKYLGNISTNSFMSRLKKRSKSDEWKTFSKMASRYLTHTPRKRRQRK